jgi:hypothetical protein
MNRLLHFSIGIGLSILFIYLGLEMVENSDASKFPLLKKSIGIANIIFFGALITWAIYKIISNLVKQLKQKSKDTD